MAVVTRMSVESDATTTTNAGSTPKQSFESDIETNGKEGLMTDGGELSVEDVNVEINKKDETNRNGDTGTSSNDEMEHVKDNEKEGTETEKDEAENGIVIFDVEKGVLKIRKSSDLGEKERCRGRACMRKCICTIVFLGLALPVLGIVLYFTVLKAPDEQVLQNGVPSSPQPEVVNQAFQRDSTIPPPPSNEQYDLVCPDEWILYNGKCYLFSPRPLSESEGYCSRKDGSPFTANAMAYEFEEFLKLNIRNIIECCVYSKSDVDNATVVNIETEVRTTLSLYGAVLGPLDPPPVDVQFQNDPVDFPPSNTFAGNEHLQNDPLDFPPPNDSAWNGTFLIHSPLFDHNVTGEAGASNVHQGNPIVTTTMANEKFGFWLGGGIQHNHGHAHDGNEAEPIPEEFIHDAFIWNMVNGLDNVGDFPMPEGESENTNDMNLTEIIGADDDDDDDGNIGGEIISSPLFDDELLFPPPQLNKVTESGASSEGKMLPHEISHSTSGSGVAHDSIPPNDELGGIKSRTARSSNWNMLCGQYEAYMSILHNSDCHGNLIEICVKDSIFSPRFL